MSDSWAPIPGWEKLYEVSNAGRVRSLDRHCNRGFRGFGLVPGRLLKAIYREGYPSVNLRDGERVEQHGIHVLVASVFVPGRGEGLEVCHRNGDRRNPQASNLRWGTRQSNILDQIAHGTHAQSSKTHCPQRHPYTKANTYSPPSRPTARHCRACMRARHQGIDPSSVIVEEEIR
ncbi:MULTISPECIES: NUMOD4 domain-containing protein [unclassified Microbacterium]|uniref:NUMOD4 domain-containing protein n=1 Tax=unclassified Microbacterium TaxID=2609290 RepID=UPI000EA97213|nr:HNH endonuclease [Microbacterium sp. ISL-108]RKN67708.1 hypothetical protein D7252_08975 [Microbacterium sp. CGR2]